MKNILFVSLSFLFFTGCQTKPVAPSESPDFGYPEIKIKKITETGVEQVTLSPQKDAPWPLMTTAPAEGLAVNSQNLVMAVIGDTGCRLKEKKSGEPSYQQCQNPAEWRYPDLVKQLLQEKMDLIVHTGDYHYREQCTNPSVCAVITPSSGLSWPVWWADFYGPTQELFKKAPFLFVRGNHEDCQRAFKGWKPLSAGSPNAFDDHCEEVEAFQLVQMGDLILINFDNSAFDERIPMQAADRASWVEKFKKLNEKLSPDLKNKEVWLLAHKPMIGFTPNKQDAEPEPMSANLEMVVREAGLEKKIDYILSGHVHNQQIVLTKPNLKQFIVGNSGTSLDSFGRVLMTEKLISSTDSKKSFGYGLFERRGFKKWTITFKNVEGVPTLKCDLVKQQLSCQ